MSGEHQQENLYSQLLGYYHFLSTLNLPFNDEFEKKWKPLLYENITDPIYSAFRQAGDGQAYVHNVDIPGILTFKLEFDITHIRKKYKQEKSDGSFNHFYIASLNVTQNKTINYFGNPCNFFYYSPKERKESYEDNAIFIALKPLVPAEFFVVDGSHRISSLVDSGAKQIPIILIDPEAVPNYLISSAEIVTYSFLLDIFIIKEAIRTNRLQNIENQLQIFKKHSMLNFLCEEKRLHGNI